MFAVIFSEVDMRKHPGEIVYYILKLRDLELGVSKGTSVSDFRKSTRFGNKDAALFFRGQIDIDVEIAEDLGDYFNNSPLFWIDLQNDYDY